MNEKSDKKCLHFIDESHHLDRQLFITARLCEAATDKEIVDEEILRGVGLQIRRYIEKRNHLENYFFKRSLEFPMSDADQRAEVLRLKLLYGQR